MGEDGGEEGLVAAEPRYDDVLAEVTAFLAERAAANPVFFSSLAGATGALVLSAGGVLVREGDGRVAGAVGISGDTAEIDELCARAGLAAAVGGGDTP